MSELFEKVVFTRVSDDDLVKTHMDGFDDPSVRDYTLISFAALFKEDRKSDGLEKEYIDSFLAAAKVLAEANYSRRPQDGHVLSFYSNSLVLVSLYLLRHCLELSIKRAISQSGVKPEGTHNLEKLWQLYLQQIKDVDRTEEDKSILEQMGDFLKLVNKIDDTGTKLRYSENRDGSLTQEQPYFLNIAKLVEATENFVKQLECASKA